MHVYVTPQNQIFMVTPFQFQFAKLDMQADVLTGTYNSHELAWDLNWGLKFIREMDSDRYAADSCHGWDGLYWELWNMFEMAMLLFHKQWQYDWQKYVPFQWDGIQLWVLNWLVNYSSELVAAIICLFPCAKFTWVPFRLLAALNDPCVNTLIGAVSHCYCIFPLLTKRPNYHRCLTHWFVAWETLMKF